jgi:hypothetical protein
VGDSVILADNGRFVLAERGTRLLFVERRILPTWLVFVPVLVTVVVVGNAAVQIGIGNIVVGLVMLGVGVLCGLGCRAALAGRRRVQDAPLDTHTTLAVIDLGSRTLFDGNGQVLSHLDAVRVDKAMQLTSSARALTLAWPGGSLAVYRGDALLPSGSISAPAAALAERGLA